MPLAFFNPPENKKPLVSTYENTYAISNSYLKSFFLYHGGIREELLYLYDCMKTNRSSSKHYTKYAKIWVFTNPYSRIFYAVKVQKQMNSFTSIFLIILWKFLHNLSVRDNRFRIHVKFTEKLTQRSSWYVYVSVRMCAYRGVRNITSLENFA